MTTPTEGMTTMTVSLKKRDCAYPNDREAAHDHRDCEDAFFTYGLGEPQERVELTGRTYRSDIVPTGRAIFDTKGIPPLTRY